MLVIAKLITYISPSTKGDILLHVVMLFPLDRNSLRYSIFVLMLRKTITNQSSHQVLNQRVDQDVQNCHPLFFFWPAVKLLPKWGFHLAMWDEWIISHVKPDVEGVPHYLYLKKPCNITLWGSVCEMFQG